MFQTRVYPNIASDEYWGAFNNIYNFDYFDSSFTAVMRIIASKRLGKEDSITLKYQNTAYSKSTLAGVNYNTIIGVCTDDINNNAGQYIKIHSLNHKDGNDYTFGILDAHWKDDDSTLRDYERLEDVERFLDTKGIKTRFYVSEKKRKALIVSESVDERKYHLFQSLLPRYTPWLFKDIPLDRDEVMLLKSLTNKTSTEFEKLVREFEEKMDLHSIIVRNKLKGFESVFEKRQLRDVETEIERVKQSIARLEREFSACYMNMNNLIVRRNGLEYKINNTDESDDEVMNYFLASKVLQLRDVSGSNISFFVKSFIDNFDIDVFDSYVSNRRSYLYRNRGNDSDFTNDDIEMFLRAAFEEEEFKIQVVAGFSMNFAEGTYDVYSHYVYPGDLGKFYIPNPHLEKYSCQGNNGEIIRESMSSRDYIGAIEACIAMTKNFNFADSAPGDYLVDWLFFRSAKPCVRMKDGTMMTPYGALKWLKNKRGIES